MKTIWLDIESGTYFSVAPLRIQTKDWSDKDWLCWEETMSDSDRQAWGEYHLASPDKQVSPSMWCNPKHEVAGWPYA